MENLKIDIFRNSQAIHNLADEWSALALQSRWPVYSCPEWYLAWWDVFGEKSKLIIVTARIDGRLVGILPACNRRSNKHGLFLKLIEPLSGGTCDYHCPVVETGLESKVLPHMLEKAFNAFKLSSTFIWPHIPVDHPSIPVMREFIKQNNYLSMEQENVCPQLILGKDYTSTENLWESKHRRDIRRQRKRIDEIGRRGLWIASSKDEMKDFLSEFFQIHAEKWQSQGLPAKCNNKRIQKHLYSMVERLWDKGLHVSTLTCGKERISYHFGFLSGGWLLCYMTAYRLKYHNLSPTKVHYSLLAEEGIKSGWTGLDFLIGNEPYKYNWSSKELKVISFIIGKSHMSPSYFWFSKGKPFIKNKFESTYFTILAFMEKLFK